MLFLSLSADTKRYEVESGEIEYVIKGGGNMMGMKSSTEGKKTVVFEKWGNHEVSESYEKNTNGFGAPEETHELTQFKNGKVASVDFEEKVIYIHDLMQKSYQGSNENYTQFGRDMLEQNGGKRVGSEKILGYNCEVWEWMGAKIWVYKGVTLKVTTNMMGMTHTEVATKARFNKKIPSSRFALPKYPTKKVEDVYNDAMEAEDMSEEEKQQAREMMQNLGGMFNR